MTLWELAATARRGWAGGLLGLAATTALLAQASSPSPVYSAQTTVVFVTDVVPSDLSRPQEGLVIMAGLVGLRVSDQLPSHSTSDTVSLLGEGVRRGYSVSVPGSGNQWTRRGDRPELRVQAVGASEAEVRATIATAQRRIAEELAAVQAPMDLVPGSAIRAQQAVTPPVVVAGAGSPPRAMAAALLLGAVATVGGSVLVGRARGAGTPSRRPHRPGARGAPRAQQPPPGGDAAPAGVLHLT